MKLPLNDIANLTNDQSATATINTNFDAIETAFDNTLSRDGTAPNQMGASLDMNSFKILNLPNPTGPLDPVRLTDIAAISGGTLSPLPAGGVTGSFLRKNSGADYDFNWSTSLTVATGKTLTANNSLTLAGTDGTTMTFPGSSDTVVTLAATQTLSNKTLASPSITGSATVTSSSSNALAVGPNGTTNPVLQVVGSTASQATGIQVVGNAAGGGGGIVAISSATNEPLILNAKGTSPVSIAGISSGGVLLCGGGGATTAAGAILSSSASGGVGYSTGAGGAVTQITGRTTGVTLNKTTGAITLFAAAPAVGTWVSCTVTNSTVAATDVVHVAVKSGTNTYIAHVTATAAGSFQLSFTSIVGTTSDSPVINFAVIKGVTS